ncbi:MAG: helix-turn-helix domain-containing protein [Alphaproteobacteria bacterium]|nr:helix-turn-helix domain-containing protein [Alphaproteobacteria bacterium]
MPRSRARTYSRYSLEAAALLGQSIRLGRREQRVTAQDLADRAGITRTTLRKIENGDMTSEIGLAFEVATLVGVKLFDAETGSIAARRERIDDRIALLPKTVRKTTGKFDDDF